MENTRKNVGKRGYAFNGLQRQLLPKALRAAKASFLSVEALERAIKKLTGESLADEHSAEIAGLKALLKLGTKALKNLRKQLGEALEQAPRVATTGERSFAAVAESVKELASRDMLEAVAG